MSAQRIVAGFMPLLDCAVLVAAAECGFAAQEGIDLRLLRETSWANIRDRLIVGQFQAAHLLGPMAVAATIGASQLRVPMLAAAALGQGGNAVSVSLALHAEMNAAGGGGEPTLDPVVQGAALRHAIAERRRRGAAPPVFATVYPFSCHTIELRYWFAACGIDPDQDVQLVVLPPPLVVDALRSGQIDGFCVGAPWSAVAVAAGAGCVVTTASHLWRQPSEKVLGMRRDWAEAQPETALALVRAVLRASEWCNEAGNHRELAALLAGPRYVGVPAELLYENLSGHLHLVPGAQATMVPDFLGFSRAAALPRAAHAVWYYRQMLRWRQCVAADGAEAAAAACFDGVLAQQAAITLGWDISATSREECLFDGQPFDAMPQTGA